MCNLYYHTSHIQAIRELAGSMTIDLAIGNLAPQAGSIQAAMACHFWSRNCARG